MEGGDGRHTETHCPLAAALFYYQVLEVGRRLEMYGTAASVNFCRPLPPVR